MGTIPSQASYDILGPPPPRSGVITLSAGGAHNSSFQDCEILNSYFHVRDSLKDSKFNNLVSISSQCQPNAGGSTRAQTALNSSMADQQSNYNSMKHLESLRHSNQSITIHKEQFIKEHIQNEVVSKMLINRIREKTNMIHHGQAKVEEHP